ncbi:MAG: UDP-N-acetylmuramate dehydrogenase [Ignavibacteriaceae bacterium]|nr:UDP-N-acetylmuramate dehydrogenase [Ignavibacteriaceae bacterium]
MLLNKNHSLKNWNTFGVDVKAKLFIEVFSEDELREILSDIKFKSERKFILGGGSNILFKKDFEGLLIKVSISGINVLEENDNSVLIEAGAGIIWNELVKFCVDGNYVGIENLTLIPGTVGAAPIQNIGAYGQEFADTFVSLNGLFVETGEQKTFIKDDCKFSYRSSIFKEELKNNFVVTSVRLRLSKNLKPNLTYKALSDYLAKNGIINPTIKEVSSAVAEIRKSKLPDPQKIGNAGSFFKNPVVSEDSFRKLKAEYSDIVSFPSESGQTKISAGWLIEKCGWKGKRVGDVGTSPDHALIICNFGNATGSEILEFAMRIKEEVANKFGIQLEEEVNIL